MGRIKGLGGGGGGGWVRRSLSLSLSLYSGQTSIVFISDKLVYLSTRMRSLLKDEKPTVYLEDGLTSVWENERFQPFKGWGNTYPGTKHKDKTKTG